MDESVSITIRISDKEFSLKVNSPEDAVFLQKAAQKLNDRIVQRSKSSHISREDVLSMVAFDLMVNSLKEEERNESLVQQLENLNSLIDQQFSS